MTLTLPVDTEIAPDSHPFTFYTPNAPASIVLSHGFTGSPASMKPWGEYLARAGFSVTCPLLPGHGETWEEANKTQWPEWYSAVDAAMDSMLERAPRTPVFLMGLSMGGTLVTRLAITRQDEVAGVVLVNPAYRTWRRGTWAVSLLSRVMPSVEGIGGDIKKPQPHAARKGRTPLRAFASLQQLWRHTRSRLDEFALPLLLFTSTEDHVVEPANSELLRSRVASTDVTSIPLENSYHVATLDYDAEVIFARSVAFVERILHEHSPR